MYFLYKFIKHKFHNFIDSKAYHATYNNPDASNREIANNVIEGTIGGALTGLTTAAFTPIGSGVPGAILGAKMDWW